MTRSTPIEWKALDDDAFVEKANMQIWLSAFASNNPRAPAHKEADAAYDEAMRRDKPWLYNRAWNKAVAGTIDVSDDMRKNASESGYRETHPDWTPKCDMMDAGEEQ